VLAATGARGVTQIRNAACEPHVAEMCRFLRAMGASVSGEGTSTITVEGGARLGGAEYRLDGDYIEAGSWGVVAAITGGEIEVTGARRCDVEVIGSVLRRMNVACQLTEDRFVVSPSRPVCTKRITTGTWPGFPSDMVSLVTVLATQAEGRTLIHDWMYELRLFALEQLSGMGADLFLCDPHRIIVSGPRKLRGRLLDTRDIRSGMALIAAGLAADGVSLIGPLETVERGYANVLERLRSLGAEASLVADRRAPAK
jgi:UDP-N-acetylglucosamine 1-carboxyvinyltransferase